MDKKEEDKIFSDYLHDIMKIETDNLETYEPLRDTISFQSYLLNVLWNKLIDELLVSFKKTFRRK